MSIFCVEDKCHDTCLKSFKLQNDPNFTSELHKKFQIKKNVSIKFCASNYARHDGLVNDVGGIFQDSSKLPILGAKFITTTFNINIQKAIHIITIYKFSTLLFSTFINQLQKLLDLKLTYFSTTIMGNFNIEIE